MGHSTKVPSTYKKAAQTARKVFEEHANPKSLSYEAKHRGREIYKLVKLACNNNDYITKLIGETGFLVKHTTLNPFLAKVLISELLWGKGTLPGNSKPVQAVLEYKNTFVEYLNKNERTLEKKEVPMPRYARVNTLLTTVEAIIETFKNEGYNYIEYTDTGNYNDFLEKVDSLKNKDFMIDIHIPEVLIFAPKIVLHNHPAYKKSMLMLQNKASCLPVHLLDPKPGSKVLDVCAAPGMKTSHIAAKIGNSGTIYAIEKSSLRYNELKKIVKKSGATCVKPILGDSLIIAREFKQAEYVLVDPSCTGSGITNRIERDLSKVEDKAERLRKLTGFQIKLLRIALKLPKAKRVVYSTCSTNIEENEMVVRDVIRTCKKYRLVDAKSFLSCWNDKVENECKEISDLCLHCNWDTDKTTGFFVAVFEHLRNGERNEFFDQELADKFKPKRKFEIEVLDDVVLSSSEDNKGDQLEPDSSSNEEDESSKNENNIKVEKKNKKRKSISKSLGKNKSQKCSDLDIIANKNKRKRKVTA